jgi:hypothetical protein
MPIAPPNEVRTEALKAVNLDHDAFQPLLRSKLAYRNQQGYQSEVIS